MSLVYVSNLTRMTLIIRDIVKYDRGGACDSRVARPIELAKLQKPEHSACHDAMECDDQDTDECHVERGNGGR